MSFKQEKEREGGGDGAFRGGGDCQTRKANFAAKDPRKTSKQVGNQPSLPCSKSLSRPWAPTQTQPKTQRTLFHSSNHRDWLSQL